MLCHWIRSLPRISLGGHSRLIRGRGDLSRRLNPASFALTMRSLSQARPLGGLHRASPGLSGAAISPPACTRRTLRPKGSLPACTGSGIFHPFHHHASWRTHRRSSGALGTPEDERDEKRTLSFARSTRDPPQDQQECSGDRADDQDRDEEPMPFHGCLPSLLSVVGLVSAGRPFRDQRDTYCSQTARVVVG
jgi:hypothetical protein